MDSGPLLVGEADAEHALTIEKGKKYFLGFFFLGGGVNKKVGGHIGQYYLDPVEEPVVSFLDLETGVCPPVCKKKKEFKNSSVFPQKTLKVKYKSFE